MNPLMRLIGNLPVWKKFLLVVVMFIPMIAVPTVIMVSTDLDNIATAKAELAGVEPTESVIRLIQLSQQHRGLAAGYLGGREDMGAARTAKQDEVQKAFARTAEFVRTLSDDHLKTDLASAQNSWQALSEAVGSKTLKPGESLARHTALIATELKLLDDIAAATQLALDPEAPSYYLVTAVTMHLPRMAEALGLARGRGMGMLAKGEGSAEERAIVGSLAERLQMHMRDAQAAIDRAVAADPKIGAQLKAPITDAQAAADFGFRLVDDKIVHADTLSYAPKEYFDAMTGVIDQQYALMSAANKVLREILAARVDANRQEMLATFALLIVLCAAAVATIILVSRSMSRGVEEAMRMSSALARGDLSATLNHTTRDEIGRVVEAIARSTASLSVIVAGIKQSSQSVSVAAEQIASGNLDLSGRTEEQASSLQQTAASMEEMTTTVRQSADTAREANELAEAAASAAGRGGAVVGEVVQTMEGISASSRKIREIISVIDSIAFQTNILALNAAVEAARAGEQGRGFAVVASEVRTLAQRSALAAREITALINESVENVERGGMQVSRAGDVMRDIVTQVNRVGSLISEISRVSLEQSSGIAEVSAAVAQMDNVTQGNAALVEETAAAAASLRDQAQDLAESVARFSVAEKLAA